MESNDRSNNISDLLKDIFQPSHTLRDLFSQRIEEINLSPTAALDIVNMPYRTLNGILDGTQKTIDYTNLVKLADFLQVSTDEVFSLYSKTLKKNFEIESPFSPEKIKFIKENFDLSVLKKSGFIDDISEYEEIERKINLLLDLKTIYEYSKPKAEAAFSSGKIKPKNELTRNFWVNTAKQVFEEIDNPYEYDQQGLIDYFPEIRWHSTSVELGLRNVIKSLYKLGVTVIYQESLPSLHLRGATFIINDKPCVVLTDYRGFYATLWFALVHELFHVIFDWDEIRNNKYHVSDEKSDVLSVVEKENEANDFARTYLFSHEKTKDISSNIHNKEYVELYAKRNHVHSSFIYLFYAYDLGNNRGAWARAKKANPDIDNLIKPLTNSWSNPRPIREYVNTIRNRYYH